MLWTNFNELKNIWCTNKEVWHMRGNWLGLHDEPLIGYTIWNNHPCNNIYTSNTKQTHWVEIVCLCVWMSVCRCNNDDNNDQIKIGQELRENKSGIIERVKKRENMEGVGEKKRKWKTCNCILIKIVLKALLFNILVSIFSTYFKCINFLFIYSFHNFHFQLNIPPILEKTLCWIPWAQRHSPHQLPHFFCLHSRKQETSHEHKCESSLHVFFSTKLLKQYIGFIIL